MIARYSREQLSVLETSPGGDVGTRREFSGGGNDSLSRWQAGQQRLGANRIELGEDIVEEKDGGTTDARGDQLVPGKTQGQGQGTLFAL